MPGSRFTAVVTALGLVLAAADAWARGPIMVWPGAPDAPVAEAEVALRELGVTPAPRTAARDALGRARAEQAERDRARQEAVETALATAQEHYLALELDAMLGVLQGAEPEALASARPGRCDGLWELEFRWGLAHGTRRGEGDSSAATDRYRLAVELDPDRRPLHELYGPDVSAAFLEAIDARSGRVSRALPLHLQPADARVEVDCHAVDGDEVSLRPGLHAVRVSAPGHRPWSQVIDTRSLDALEVALVALPGDEEPARRLAQSTDADAVDDGSVSAHALLLELARSQGAAGVLVVSPAAEGWRVRPWGRDGIGAAVTRAELPEALDAALGLLDDEGRLRAPRPTPQGVEGASDPVTPTRRPVVRTWWFWTIVGTAVATGVAVGLGVGLSRREAPPGRLVIVAR